MGYTLIAAKYIAGRIDKGIKKDDFEGCDFDRIIVDGRHIGRNSLSYAALPLCRGYDDIDAANAWQSWQRLQDKKGD